MGLTKGGSGAETKSNLTILTGSNILLESVVKCVLPQPFQVNIVPSNDSFSSLRSTMTTQAHRCCLGTGTFGVVISRFYLGHDRIEGVLTVQLKMTVNFIIGL